MTALDANNAVASGAADAVNGRGPLGRLAPGSTEFTILLALSMAASALSIDTLLPALDDIRASFNLAADSSETAALITMFMLGSGLALVPAGLLADRFGRRVVLWGGFGLYLLGSVGAALAPSLKWMLVARFVWGIGAAGPRVTAMAMVRDVYSGEKMAKQMSFMMAVFILVPVMAPTIGSGLIAVGPWRLVFWLCAGAGVLVLIWSMRLPETLHESDQRSLAARDVVAGARTVIGTAGTKWFVVAQVALFGVFLSYLGTSELIIDDVYDKAKWFPLFFSGLAVAMGIVMVINGRIVERVGLDRLNRTLLVIYTVGALALTVCSVAFDGQPAFWLFTGLLVPILGAHGVLVPNINSAAMRPLGAIAGLGAAILGMTATVLGSLIGNRIDSMFNGSTTPFCVAFFASGVIALVAVARGTAAQQAAASGLSPTVAVTP
jgi:MFS transporter, DHA1 family, multidrug resistance protein